ncbi:hypothetical protein Tco_0238215 [Tanacetum coccineum]
MTWTVIQISQYLEGVRSIQTLWDVKPRVEEIHRRHNLYTKLFTQLRQGGKDSEEKTLVTNGNGTEITTTPTTPTTLAISIKTNAQRQQGCLQLGKVLTPANYLTAESVDNTTLTHALLLVTTVEGQDIRPKTVELHLVLRAKEDP